MRQDDASNNGARGSRNAPYREGQVDSPKRYPSLEEDMEGFDAVIFGAVKEEEPA